MGLKFTFVIFSFVKEINKYWYIIIYWLQTHCYLMASIILALDASHRCTYKAIKLWFDETWLLIACRLFLWRLSNGALMIFFWAASLQATTTYEFVRKFITTAWPLIKVENIVRQRISEGWFFVIQTLLSESQFSETSFTRYSGIPW